MATITTKPFALNVGAKRMALLVVLLWMMSLLISWASAVLLDRTHSPDAAYFNYLADAFLHGRTYLIDPPAYDDLTNYAGKWYVAFPPLPALLLLPWVALRGVDHTNMVVFGAMMGATNVVLAFLLLQTLSQRGWSPLTLIDNLWLTLLFGLGTVHWYMATVGTVWYVSQICTVTFLLLAAWIAALRGSALLSGAALALAMLARPHVVLLYPLLVALAFYHACDQHVRVGRHWVIRWISLSLVPLACSGALLLGYNHLRFDNPLNFGYLQQQVKDELLVDLRIYGQFDLHYVPHNLWAMVLAGPVWDADAGRILPTVHGMSLWLTTPAIVYIFEARQRSAVVLGAWITLGLLLIPLLTYYNTGWWQFGYRFSLDFMTPVLVRWRLVLDHASAQDAVPHLAWCSRQRLGRLVVSQSHVILVKGSDHAEDYVYWCWKYRVRQKLAG